MGEEQDLRLRRRLIGSAGFVLFLALAGTASYHLVEGWSLLDSFYMVVIALTTVGFGTVDELHTGGTILTVVLVIFGVGAALYAAATTAEYVVEGHLAGHIRRRRRERLVARLQDHYIVCGFGRMGQGAVSEFLKDGERVCAIEADESRFALAETLGLPAARGDATEEKSLIAAGVGKAKGLVATLDSDARNAFVALTSRSLAPHVKIVARAEAESALSKLCSVGADYALTLYDAGARQTAFLLTKPLVAETISMLSDDRGEGAMALRQVEIQSGSPIEDSPIRSLPDNDLHVNILAVKRPGAKLRCMPEPEDRLLAGDQIVVVGAPEDLDRLAGRPT